MPLKNNESYRILRLKLIFNLLTLIVSSITALIGMYMIINYRILQLLNLTSMEAVALIVSIAVILYLRKSPPSQGLPFSGSNYQDNYNHQQNMCNYPNCRKDLTNGDQH